MDKHQVHTYLSDEQYEYVRKKAFEKKTSISEFIKKSIGSYEGKEYHSTKVLDEGDSKPLQPAEKNSGDFSKNYNPTPKPGKKK